MVLCYWNEREKKKERKIAEMVKIGKIAEETCARRAWIM